MLRFSLTSLLIAALTLIPVPSAQAAAITYVNQDFNNDRVRGWRTIGSGGGPKTLDLDGDDIYGTAGYLMFATLAQPQTGFTNVFPNPNNLYTLDTTATGGGGAGNRLTSLNSLPAGVSIANGWLAPNEGLSADFYPLIDNPLGGDDVRVGFARRNTNNAPNGINGEFFDITLGADTPGVGNPDAVLRLGVYLHNDTNAGVADFVRLQQDGVTNTGFNENFAGDFGSTIMFYDITNYQAGDVISVYVQGRDTSNLVAVSGLTFDVLIPEPASLALLAAGGLVVLGRRRGVEV